MHIHIHTYTHTYTYKHTHNILIHSEIMDTLSTDTRILRRNLENLSLLSTNIVDIVGSLIIMFLISWQQSMLMLIVVFAIVIAGYAIIKFLLFIQNIKNIILYIYFYFCHVCLILMFAPFKLKILKTKT